MSDEQPTRRQRDLLRGRGATIDRDSDATTTDADPTQPTERGAETPVERARRRSPRRSRTETVRAETTTDITTEQRDLLRGRGDSIQTPAVDRSGDALDPDARPPTAEERTQLAEQTPFEPDEIAGVSPTDGDEVTVSPTAAARERIAREQFEAGRRFDPREGRLERLVSDPFTARAFDTDELEFEATGDGVTARPAREARARVLEEQRDAVPEPTGDADEPVDTPAGFSAEVSDRIDGNEEPGAAARAFDRFTDGFRQTSPATATGLSVLGASFRTDRGLPIPGTDRRLPGGDDFDAFRERFDPAAERIDAGISSSVDTATPDADIAPLDLGDIPVTDPATAAVGTTLATETGQRGAQRGVETGLQAFNPARITQDVATFTEFGVRGADAAIQADADQVQTGIDVGTAAVDVATDVGPAVGGAAVASDPSRLFSAPAAAATIGVVGAGVGTGAVAGVRGAGAAGRAVRRGVGDVTDVAAMTGRRTRRNIGDIEIELARDPDAGVVDIDPGVSDLLPTVRPRDRVRTGAQRAELGARRTVRTGDEFVTDARFTVDQSVRAARDAPRVARQRIDTALRRGRRDLDETVTDIGFSADRIAQRVRDAPGEARQRLDIAGRRAARSVDEFSADLRFAASDARRRPSELAENIGETIREVRTTGFIGDTGTGRTRPFLGGADRAAAARRRIDDLGDSAFLSDTGTGRFRPTDVDLPEVELPSPGVGFGRRFDTPDIGTGGFLSDTRTGRFRPTDIDLPDIELPGLGLGSRRFDTPDIRTGGFLSDTRTGRFQPTDVDLPDVGLPSVPSRPTLSGRSPVGDEGGLRDLTLRIGTAGRRRDTIDVEDLVGPDEASGAPLFRDRPFEPDADAGGPVSFSQIDTDIDVGGGQVARVRQDQLLDRVRPMDRRTGRRAREREGTDPFAILPIGLDDEQGVAAGGQIAAVEEPIDADAAMTPELDAPAAAEGVADEAAEADRATGAGVGIGASTLVGADTFVGPFAGTEPVAGTEVALDQPAAETTAVDAVQVRPPRRSFRRPPPFGLDGPDAGGDDSEVDIGFDDAVFESPTQTFDEIEADFERRFGGLDEIAEGFDAP